MTVSLELGQAGTDALAHDDDGVVIRLEAPLLDLLMDDVECSERRRALLEHPQHQPHHLALLRAVLRRVTGDPTRVGLRIEQPDRGVEVIEIADDLPLFRPMVFQHARKLGALLDQAGDGVGSLGLGVFHAEERSENNGLVSPPLGVFAT